MCICLGNFIRDSNGFDCKCPLHSTQSNNNCECENYYVDNNPAEGVLDC